MFLSTITNKIDKKGRVSVPAQFRAALNTQQFAGVVVFRSVSLPILEGCGYDTLMKLSQANEMSALMPAQNYDYTSLMFAEAQLLGFDAEGRISMPQHFLDYTGATDQITFVGRGPRFEMWESRRFEQHHQELRQRFMTINTGEGGNQ